MPAWLIWVILGIILLIFEILTPEFVIGSFVLGCFAAALVSLFSPSLGLQLLVFSGVTASVLWKIRPIFLDFLDSEEAKTNVDLLVGSTGWVTETIGPHEERGRVKIGGEDWPAVTESGCEIEENNRVQVLEIEGNKLIVQKFEE